MESVDPEVASFVMSPLIRGGIVLRENGQKRGKKVSEKMRGKWTKRRDVEGEDESAEMSSDQCQRKCNVTLILLSLSLPHVTLLHRVYFFLLDLCSFSF